MSVGAPILPKAKPAEVFRKKKKEEWLIHGTRDVLESDHILGAG